MSAPPTCKHCGGALDFYHLCTKCQRENDPRIGLELVGRYVVGPLIGRGGLGRVYAGTHLQLGTRSSDVAIKFLLRQYCAEPELRERFRREARALAELRHPAIVSIIDIGEHDGELFMVLERIRGVTLAAELERGPMPKHRICALFDQIIEVVEVAHSLGVIHRDLKPDNVMLPDGTADRVKVLDFGLAYLEDANAPRLTDTGVVQGTPAYMSPEQCRGRDIGPKTDVYSLGVMLFEAFTGELPYQAAEMTGYFTQHMFVQPPTMKEVAPDRPVSEGIEAVVRAALAKEVAVRPNASELRAMLAAAGRGTDPVSLRAAGSLARNAAAGLSRSERALTSSPGIIMTAAPMPEGPGVVLWASAGARRVASLRDTLAVSRTNVRIVDGDDPAVLGDVKVVVVLAEPDGALRVRMLRADPRLGNVPVMVVDAVDVAQTLELIRVGANDAALRGASDADIAKSIARLARRGR